MDRQNTQPEIGRGQVAFKPSAAGTRSDLRAAHPLATYIPYLASPREAQRFIELALDPILDALPDTVHCVDLGGAHGVLASGVLDALEASGRSARVTVVDANPRELEAAQRRGLEVLQANLEDLSLTDVDLLTMRLVNHYNPLPVQQQILSNAWSALQSGGWLLCQIEGGSTGLARLRTRIGSLAAGEGGGRHWIGDQEFRSLLGHAGFRSVFRRAVLEFPAVPLRTVLEESWLRLAAGSSTPLMESDTFLSRALAEAELACDEVPELVSASAGSRSETLALRSVHSVWTARRA